MGPAAAVVVLPLSRAACQQRFCCLPCPPPACSPQVTQHEACRLRVAIAEKNKPAGELHKVCLLGGWVAAVAAALRCTARPGAAHQLHTISCLPCSPGRAVRADDASVRRCRFTRAQRLPTTRDTAWSAHKAPSTGPPHLHVFFASACDLVLHINQLSRALRSSRVQAGVQRGRGPGQGEMNRYNLRGAAGQPRSLTPARGPSSAEKAAFAAGRGAGADAVMSASCRLGAA